MKLMTLLSKSLYSLFSSHLMRKTVFIIMVFSFFVACKKQGERACYICTQKIVSPATAQSKERIDIKSITCCDMTHTDILKLKKENPASYTSHASTYPMECTKQ